MKIIYNFCDFQRPESKLSFEGETYTGPDKIVLKYIVIINNE